MSELPKGWVETTLGEISSYVSRGKSPKYVDESRLPVINQRCIRWEHIDARYLKFVDPATWSSWDEDRFCKLNDILWNSTGTGTIGRAAIFQGFGSYERVVVDSHVTIIRSAPQMNPVFVWRYIQSPQIQDTIEEMQSGSTNQVELNRSAIVATRLPLPPLAEQQRIVAKLDNLLSATARARKELDAIPALVDAQKRALLAAAFTGELLNQKSVKSPKLSPKCWDIPATWRWTTFSEVAEVASNLVQPSTIPNLPHIAPDNIESGTGRLLPYRTISEDGLISAKNRFFPGQVLYSKIRPYLRKAVLIDFDGACSADMYPVTASSELIPKFLLYWLISEDFAQFSALHEGRSVLPKINRKALDGTPFPLPPLGDQAETVRRLEASFSWLDRMAAEHARAKALIHHLDRAILARAFEGRLVPQDPNDEPASILLDRIKTERAASTPEKRGRGRPKTQKEPKTMMSLTEQLRLECKEWPAKGLSFEELRKRKPGAYDPLKDAIFELLQEETPVLEQAFDPEARVMRLRKIAA